MFEDNALGGGSGGRGADQEATEELMSEGVAVDKVYGWDVMLWGGVPSVDGEWA